MTRGWGRTALRWHEGLTAFRARPVLRWLLAVGIFGIALATRFAVSHLLPPQGFPFLTFFPAIVVSALVAGLGPGLLVTVLSTLAAWYWFIAPAGALVFSPTDAVALAFFLSIGLVDCFIIHGMHRGLDRAGRIAATLEARVAERTAALEAEVRERLRAEAALAQSRRLEALGQLAGGVAHDFNNLLTVVMGQADRISMLSADEKVRRASDLVRRASERGAGLTAQMLAFARRQPLRPETLDLALLLPALRELIGRTIGDSIRVSARTMPGLWRVLADPAGFESAVLNLAINARDAMPGGGRLSLEAANRRLDARQAASLGVAPGDYVALVVADTGVGMTPEVMARAFEPFFTTKDEGRGTGLGLAQIHGFARQSEGNAVLESAPGAGTRVTLLLPRSLAPPKAAAAPKAVEAAPGRGRLVLVVEDQGAVREVVAAALEDGGWQVQAAPDGASACALLEGGLRPALVVSDVMMPGGIAGPEVARRARALNVPALLISGQPQEGVGPVLHKPFHAAELLAAAHAVASGRELPPAVRITG